MSPNDSNAQHVVTAVIVAHDGARWIPEVARALGAQTRSVDRIVAVDTGSRDRSGMLLARMLGNAAVFGAERGTGFGTAVAQALRHRAANTPMRTAGRGGAVEWVWLLHDDCVPATDALERLLDAASHAPHAAVLGPKVMDWNDRRIIVEAGIAIDGSGRRETGIEPDELDQGQQDGERDVLAVGSAGMLVRRDVWNRLGGFDLGLKLFRDDLDFCWRVITAGYRVKLVTAAVVYHLEATSRRLRPAAAARRPRRLDRRNALFVLFANLPLYAMAVSVLRNVAGSLLRALIMLATKQPGAAWDEMAALGSVLGDPVGLFAARRRRAPGRSRAYPMVRSFIPRGRAVGRLTDIVGTALAGSQQGSPADDDEEALLTDTGFAQRVMTHPGVLAILGLAIVALVAERSLLHGGWLGGGALVPVHGGAADLWREYLAGYHDVGLGSTANTPPYVAVLAVASTLALGKPWLVIAVLLLGCVPLAGITAYLAARKTTSHMSARVWVACSYALLPVATGAVSAGRLGTAVAFVLMPVIGILASRMVNLAGRRGRQAAWAAGLVVAVTAAFVPLVWGLSVIVAALAFLAFGGDRRQTVVNFGIVVLVPGVLLAPWTVALFLHPSLFLLEAGLQQPGLANPALPVSSLLLLSPGGPGLPPVWVTAGFGLTGLAALLMRRGRILAAAGWGVALCGLLIAITVSRIRVTPPLGGPAVPGWPGVALTFAATGVLLAAIAAAEPLIAMLRARGTRRIAGILVALAACCTPAMVAGTWVVSGVRGPLTAKGETVLPGFVTASAENGMRVRTLVLRPWPRPVRYTVLRNADPAVGDLELAQRATARRALDRVVGGLVTGEGGELGDDGRALGQFAIGFVLLPAPLDQRFVRVLDGTPGLRPVSLTASFGLWQVTEMAARVRVVEPGGQVVGVRSGRVTTAGAKAPASGGTLVLAEPADSGWQASLNGRALAPLAAPVDGWAQGFNLPAGGGRLDISRSMLGRQVVIGLEAAALMTVVVFALPSPRPEDAVEENQARPHPSASRRRRRKVRAGKRSRGAEQPAARTGIPVRARRAPDYAVRARPGAPAPPRPRPRPGDMIPPRAPARYPQDTGWGR